MSKRTAAGHIKNLPFVCSAGALKTLREYRQGESDSLDSAAAQE
ncbi:hypothetical protein [Streptomyces spiralis]